MKSLITNFKDKSARVKSKKSIFTTIGIIVAIAIAGTIFTRGGSFFRIFLAVAILIVVVVAMYFWLRAADDLPNITK
ncbi:MAG: hypothetical protein FK734_15695 [Asgard group archaeon]|nr:hypothetical protein [Asgard group archaeon]